MSTCEHTPREPGQDIAERLLRLGIAAELVAKQLPSNARGRHVAVQLVRCATAAGANYEEARAPESRADFIHKVGVALKELREAGYWLSFVSGAGLATVDPALRRKSPAGSDFDGIEANSIVAGVTVRRLSCFDFGRRVV